MAGVERIELSSKVLETSVLPLNQTPIPNPEAEPQVCKPAFRLARLQLYIHSPKNETRSLTSSLRFSGKVRRGRAFPVLERHDEDAVDRREERDDLKTAEEHCDVDDPKENLIVVERMVRLVGKEVDDRLPGARKARGYLI